MISIFFVFVFMMQALPVMHWIYGPNQTSFFFEMTNEKDTKEKEDTQKEKDSKENIILHKLFYNKHVAYKSNLLILLPSENAIIMHHADINTPPPDING